VLELLALQRLHVGPIDLRVDPGECVAIEGKSGSGKSVLLRAIADLDPHEGDARLEGQACSAMPAPQWRKRVTYVAAESGWWAEHIADHFASRDELARWLPRVGLDAQAVDWPVARLSTGERQRVALLRALTAANRVLLLDEPTSGLDADTRDLVETVLRERLAAGGAIVLVTHDPQLARRIAARRFVMDAGHLREAAA
jgi:ABC-type iron transport system FetAB ATPase subunit